MQTGIYEIVNTVNGKRYVGSSVDIKKRWQAHMLELRKGTHHAQHLQRSYNKYGEDKFILVIIRYCERDELLAYEQEELDSGFDYNSSPTAGNNLGFRLSQETKDRYSASKREKYLSNPEYKNHVDNMSKGVPKSNAWKVKMSERHSGIPKPQSQIEKMGKSRSRMCLEVVRQVRDKCDAGERQVDVAKEYGLPTSQVQKTASRSRYAWLK